MTNLIQRLSLIAGLTLATLACHHYQKEDSNKDYRGSENRIEYQHDQRPMHRRGHTYQIGTEDSMMMGRGMMNRMEMKCENKCEGKMDSCNYQKNEATMPGHRMMGEGKEMMKGRGMMMQRGEGMKGKMMDEEIMIRGSSMMDEKGNGMYEMRGKMMGKGRMNMEGMMNGQQGRMNNMSNQKMKIKYLAPQKAKEQNVKILHYE